MPAVEEAEQRRLDVLSPALLAPRQLERRDPRQPQRLTRMREKTASRTTQVVSQGACDRDAIIQVGLYRSHPYTHWLCMVSVLWQGTWSRSDQCP
jgi:hypothetical protein